MATYTIERDVDNALVICRIDGVLDDITMSHMARDCRAALIQARSDFDRLRVLFDNSRSTAVSASTAKIMADAMRDLWREGDRTAVVASDSLSKVQAKQTMRSGGKVFISEKAARMWLAA